MDPVMYDTFSVLSLALAPKEFYAIALRPVWSVVHKLQSRMALYPPLDFGGLVCARIVPEDNCVF